MASVQEGVESFEVVFPRAAPAMRMTEDEFVAWCGEDTRAEWVDGEVVVISPASTIHNRLTQFLLSLLDDFVAERGLGEAFGSDLSVRLLSKRRLPDALFVARDLRDRLHDKHFEGAPSLIIDVVSEDSVDRDWRVKYLEYQAAGVGEYWVVDPLYKRIEVYALGDDATYHTIGPVEGKLASRAVPGFYIRPEWLWQDLLPKVPGVLHELLAGT